MNTEETEPRYAISIAAKMIGVRPHTLRYYERVGIIEPSRSRGNIRLYSNRDIVLLCRAKKLMDELGVNLAGIEVILRMLRQIYNLQSRLDEKESELKRLREVDEL